MQKRTLKLNSLFFDLNYDGMGLVYAVKRIWIIPFKLMGFATHINILLNTVVHYNLVKSKFRPGLIIYFHVHRCNEILNIRKTAPIFGLRPSVLEILLQEMDLTIQLSKDQKNIAFTQLKRGVISRYYGLEKEGIAVA